MVPAAGGGAVTSPSKLSPAPRASTRADRLVAAAREAGAVRAYQTDPDVVALRVERVRGWSSRLIWVGIILGLAFTMANVQHFAAQGAGVGSLPWITAWLLDPMVSLVLVGILLAEQVTARYQVPMGRWPRIAKWGALVATYTMNTWQAWTAGSLAQIVLHSVPPLMVFVAVEAFPAVRDRLTEAVLVAERDARRRRGRVDPEPSLTVDTDAAVVDARRNPVEVAQPRSATSGRNLAVARTATAAPKVAQPAGRNRARNPGGATEAMRNHWDAELTRGRIPSGVELARVGGVSGQYGRKLRADWITGVAQPAGDNPDATAAPEAGSEVAQHDTATGSATSSATAATGTATGATRDRATGGGVAQPDRAGVAPSVNGQR